VPLCAKLIPEGRLFWKSLYDVRLIVKIKYVCVKAQTAEMSLLKLFAERNR